jgi:hypothetical protein
MKSDDLIRELEKHIDPTLAKDLVSEYMEIQHDCKTRTLGGSSAGKFIETVVQVMQFLEKGSYDKKPNVDFYLKDLESSLTPLNDGLKLCCARVARSCYTFRNKRSIAHKGSVDPNTYDLNYIYTSSQWILSEIVRQVITSNMNLAGRMIEFIQIPVSPIIEEFGTKKLVYGNLTTEKEILVLLHSHYPEYASRKEINASLDRRSESTISNSLKKLWKNKLIHKDESRYKLTQEGFKEARNILIKNEGT